MEPSWNSIPLEIAFETLGWIACCSWASCTYPQLFLNFRRKSVVGLNFDFVLMNLTKQICYLIYNASMYFSSAVQRQYRQQYGLHEMIPVAANDVAFSIHAVLMYLLILFQILIYDIANQRFSKTAVSIVSAAWFAAAICIIIALPSHSWLWLVSVFNFVQVIMTVIKYMPQAYMNYARKSTRGFSIGFVLLDFLGGTTNIGQMATESLDQGSWVNFHGNMGKLALSLISVFYDILFMFQHYVQYPHEGLPPEVKEDFLGRKPLLESDDKA